MLNDALIRHEINESQGNVLFALVWI